MQKTGYADLPLHNGRVPEWLASRMAKLGRGITESIVQEYGKKEMLKRLSDPLWFQSFGAVLGMDWHSSGITTSVMGALKRSLNPIAKDLGIYVCGGRGKHSRKTPTELKRVGDRTGIDGDYLAKCSRLSAKVDNTAVQDGFQIYLHSFVVTDEGDWAVIQQGMNSSNGYARRYHWQSDLVDSFINEPHASVCGENQGLILNLTASDAKPTRHAMLETALQHPDRFMKEFKKAFLPRHHDVRAKDVDMKRLGSIIALAYETNPNDFESLLLLKGLGPKTLQSLTLVSEIIHGTPSRFTDPARFSFAHGGKDGHPFPVPTYTYDDTIDMLNHSLIKAKLGQTEKREALKSLHKLAKKIEQNFVPNENFDRLIEREKAMSPSLGGRTVFDDQSRKKIRKSSSQLSLF